MKLLQEKSKCCAAKIIRFGGKRRQCTVCKKTWRIRPAKRGRKALRKQEQYVHKVFAKGFSVKQLAVNSNLSVDVIYKRFNYNLTDFINRKRIIRIKGRKLILLIDALWQYFKGELWTVYCCAVKAANSKKVIILDPVLRSGRENSVTWQSILNTLPAGIKNRIIALVSDGIRGIDTVVANNGWIMQRCHFHLLSSLQKMRGKRASTPGRLMREEIYRLVILALRENSKGKLQIICRRLSFLAGDGLCPVKMRMIVRDFLRRITEFRNYLKYPALHLPTTVNVMESVNSLIRRKARTVNSPQSWHKWAKATVKFKPKFNCQ